MLPRSVSVARAPRAPACRTTRPFAADPLFPEAPTRVQIRAGPWESAAVRFPLTVHRGASRAQRAHLWLLWDSLREFARSGPPFLNSNSFNRKPCRGQDVQL